MFGTQEPNWRMFTDATPVCVLCGTISTQLLRDPRDADRADQPAVVVDVGLNDLHDAVLEHPLECHRLWICSPKAIGIFSCSATIAFRKALRRAGLFVEVIAEVSPSAADLDRLGRVVRAVRIGIKCDPSSPSISGLASARCRFGPDTYRRLPLMRPPILNFTVSPRSPQHRAHRRRLPLRP